MPDLLACPSCRAPAIREGVSLRCGCSRYPVIEGIPIFAEWARNRTMTLEQVLAHHLPARPSLAGKIFRRLFSGQARVRQALSAPGTTFIDLAASLGRQGDLDYFRYRFSDLSYLSTSALLTPLTRGPVLDLGCGAGHGIHALLRRIPKALVVGLDLNYSLLYLAKRFVAPQALLVCADASTRLPFLEGAFEAAYSADTFQYLSDRSAGHPRTAPRRPGSDPALPPPPPDAAGSGDVRRDFRQPRRPDPSGAQDSRGLPRTARA